MCVWTGLPGQRVLPRVPVPLLQEGPLRDGPRVLQQRGAGLLPLHLQGLHWRVSVSCRRHTHTHTQTLVYQFYSTVCLLCLQLHPLFGLKPNFTHVQTQYNTHLNASVLF